MTGSLFRRQHSSSGDCGGKREMTRPKFRRCSSVDDSVIIELAIDDHPSPTECFLPCDKTVSDDDSGIEDSDQKLALSVCSQPNKGDEKESTVHNVTCEDKILDNYAQQIVAIQPMLGEQYSTYSTVHLASKVPDDEKKTFCPSTCDIFHGEFALRILCPIKLRYTNINYHLLPENVLNSDPCKWKNFAFVKLDNAKAQFKCKNINCRRLWTSMRARISFKISYPNESAFVVLKIYEQVCQICETPAEALWYPEEACRAMKNLAETIFTTFFPDMINCDNAYNSTTTKKMGETFQTRCDNLNQRIGKMKAPHDRFHCEACRLGWCFN